MKFTRDYDTGEVTVDAFDPHVVVAIELLEHPRPELWLRWSEPEGMLTLLCTNGIATYLACSCSSTRNQRCFNLSCYTTQPVQTSADRAGGFETSAFPLAGPTGWPSSRCREIGEGGGR